MNTLRGPSANMRMPELGVNVDLVPGLPNFYMAPQQQPGFPMGWTPASDSLMHGAWLTAEVTQRWIQCPLWIISARWMLSLVWLSV